VPARLAALVRDAISAYRRANVEWILAHADPAIEIVQPPEFPDARTYHGRDGLLDALLDWPTQWQHFYLEPRRIFAIGEEHIVTVALHHGRAREIDIEVEAEIVWLTRWRGSRTIRWDMFMNVDDALRAAGASGEASSTAST
jgi:ketosteroid isomerase-like protein